LSQALLDQAFNQKSTMVNLSAIELAGDEDTGELNDQSSFAA